MPTHYVCTGGCLTVRYAPSYCPVVGCPRHRNQLTTCECTDDEHGDLLFRNHPEREKKEAEYKASKLKKSHPEPVSSETKPMAKPAASRTIGGGISDC